MAKSKTALDLAQLWDAAEHLAAIPADAVEQIAALKKRLELSEVRSEKRLVEIDKLVAEQGSHYVRIEALSERAEKLEKELEKSEATGLRSHNLAWKAKEQRDQVWGMVTKQNKKLQKIVSLALETRNSPNETLVEIAKVARDAQTETEKEALQKASKTE